MTNTTQYLTITETAKLVRAVLKEAFPIIKFSVKSSSYSKGASISVSWTDGANEAQVKAMVNRFSSSYFDSLIDYKGSIHHIMDGKRVRFASDSISLHRVNSDDARQSAINRVWNKYHAEFAHDGLEKPTVEAMKRGEYFTVQFSRLHKSGIDTVQREINTAMNKHTYTPKTLPSPTASRVMVIGDDGYSLSVGSGKTVVNNVVAAEFAKPAFLTQLKLVANNR